MCFAQLRDSRVSRAFRASSLPVCRLWLDVLHYLSLLLIAFAVFSPLPRPPRPGPSPLSSSPILGGCTCHYHIPSFCWRADTWSPRSPLLLTGKAPRTGTCGQKAKISRTAHLLLSDWRGKIQRTSMIIFFKSLLKLIGRRFSNTGNRYDLKCLKLQNILKLF